MATKAPPAVLSVKERLRMLEDKRWMSVHVMERIAETQAEATGAVDARKIKKTLDDWSSRLYSTLHEDLKHT